MSGAIKTTIGGEIRYTHRGRVILISYDDWGHWFWTDEEFKDDGPDNPLFGTFTNQNTLGDVFAEIRDAVADYLVEVGT